jgi:hypothetical protein
MKRLALVQARSTALGVTGLCALFAVGSWYMFALAFSHVVAAVDVGIGIGLWLAGAVVMTALAAAGLVVAWLASVADAVVPRSRRPSPSG